MNTDNIFKISSVENYLSRLHNFDEFKFDSLTTAILREYDADSGYFEEILKIEFGRNGEIVLSGPRYYQSPDEFDPDDTERDQMRKDLLAFPWPKLEFIDLNAADLPVLWQQAPESERWIFRDKDGNIEMLQVLKRDKGKKKYIPITRWDDVGYRFKHPYGPRPIYNLDLVKKHGASTVFLHEGANGARAAQSVADDAKSKHPWKQELSHTAHLGVIGGARAISDTDFAQLKRLGVTTYYVVPDNDEAGKQAAQKMARRLDGVVYIVQVGADFPPAWDFGNDMPAKFFNKSGNWTGPTFNSTIFPATQATYSYQDEKNKTRLGLRREFSSQWYFVNDEATFVHRRFPELQKTEKAFNDYVAPHSAAKDTAELLKREATCHIDGTVYRPGKRSEVLTEGNRRLFNVYRAHDFPAIDGDATLWDKFVEYLLPDETERKEFLRWFYTILAVPETRTYSCLMYSEAQGTGKSTVADILYRIIGPRNASVANPKSLESQFNSHFENKRLVIFQELYEGGSNFKTTNSLKTVLTDDFIRINSKYRQERTIENHTHIFAASNSSHALDLDDKERRWLVVGTTETPWSQAEFADLREWLFDDVGCNIILAEANKFNDHVKRGERAPETKSKNETVFQSKSEIEMRLDDFHSNVDEDKQLVAVETKVIHDFLTGSRPAHKSDSLQKTIQRFKKKGWGYLSQRDDEFDGYRPYISKRKINCLVSPALKAEMKNKDEKDAWLPMIEKAWTQANDLSAF